ncbi:MAG: helix-turn-helix transcriptional regulator [Saprospiraceae bacterium]|nr:helix-turn-helix transcriptional regulator [Saprospiraceae bacterium]MCB0627461.1 helix-turn-helix transcriptional regulator [Saprospiraceae bacterium]MCB0675453.1 helix-turn-helix transcriptional regulator [Saprospiraceae bacterium]MCB0683120.1 helix-turn-helix transcriptional regulator [Saprospiraceae bacterium]
MPAFEFEGRIYNNPVELALDKIGGKWKMPLLWRLKDGVWRYGELRKSFEKNDARITHQMLTKQLKELVADGYIHRKVYAVVPPKVEYSLTEKGERVIPVILALRDYGLALMEEAGLE